MSKKTNNSSEFLYSKKVVREHALRIAKNKKILNLFAGENTFYRKNEDVDNFDILSYNGKNIKGNAIKILKSININNYSIIDIDCYGSSFIYLDEIIKHKFSGIIVLTDIQSIYSNFSDKLKEYNGVKLMSKKCPSLFNNFKNLYLFNYLYDKNIKEIFGIIGKKSYFCVDLQLIK